MYQRAVLVWIACFVNMCEYQGTTRRMDCTSLPENAPLGVTVNCTCVVVPDLFLLVDSLSLGLD